jgi:ribosomal-protein-serine acetyltransferase
VFALSADDEVSIELAEMHHAAETFALVDRNREHLRPWMPWVDGTKTVADSEAFLTFIRAEYAAGKQFHANLRYRGAMVGAIGMRFDRMHAKAEVGYWLDSGHEGRGIVTRATRAVTTAAFAEFGMVRVGLHAAVENTRSRAVAERLGFTFEGVLRRNEKIGDRWVDHAVYAAFAGEWPDADTLRGNP